MWLFVYGTLMDPEKVKRILKRLPKSRIAYLPGYELTFNKKGDKGGNPNLKPGRGVWGVVYDVNESDLRKLDLVSPKYARKYVEVLVDGKPVKAWVYIAKPEYTDDGLKPDRSCIERMVRGARYHGLPEDYVNWLENLMNEL